jgi:RHS repeat-associated protein
LPPDGIISVPSEIVQEEHYYPFGMKLTGPWIGVGAAAGAKSAYQYNGIDHVDAFELNVNMAMYRTLDPVLGRWWSVDPAAEKYMSWTPYNSMGNSPIVQIDPNGDVLPFLAIVAIGAAVFGTGNLAAQAIAGDINNLGDGLRAFGTGAVAGATLTAGFALGFGVPVLGPVLKGALILKATTTGISALGGAIRGTTTGDWSGLGNAGKIFLGNFYSDPERSFFSQTLQLTSRHSWEFLQTEIGHSYSQIRNAVGRVDRVDLYRGATFTQRYNTGTGFRRGISLGNFINIAVSSDDPGVTLENEPDRRSRPGLLRHEYGHIFDSHRWGPLYLFGIGIPSAAGAEWTENRADSFWRTYFNRHP